jgi:hypothetical protein
MRERRETVSTVLGRFKIHSIEDEGRTVRGTFVSIFQQNVYLPSPRFGLAVLAEGWDQLGRPAGSWTEILEPVHEALRKDAATLKALARKDDVPARFTSPGTPSTEFVLTVTKPELAGCLRAGMAWESYHLG